jgi:hypothetical protein
MSQRPEYCGHDFFFSFFIFSNVDFELKASHWQALYHLSHAPSPLSLGIFSDRVFHFLPGARLDHKPLTYISHISGMTGLFVEMGISLTFCLGWSQSAILPVSTSLVARISSVSHWAQHCFSFFFIAICK